MFLNKTGLIELAKSFGRFMWFGLLGLIAMFLTSLAADQSLLQTTITIGNMSFNVGVVLVALIGFIVKAIDRYQHARDDNSSNGLAPKFLQQ